MEIKETLDVLGIIIFLMIQNGSQSRIIIKAIIMEEVCFCRKLLKPWYSMGCAMLYIPKFFIKTTL